MRKQPKVNEVNEFLEIASDFEDPMELIRESLSNSFDANASEVNIRIRTRNVSSDIVIEDDGDGMGLRDFESFFDLGNSRKTDSIGYKGHGTKIFYKSDNIVVNSTHDGTTRHAEMNEPWEKLNNKELPEYTIRESETQSQESGTYIKITGFRSGEGLSPENLTYNKIEHYLKWKTIAGSTAHFFDEDSFQEMDITIELDDEIDPTDDVLHTTNKFEFPDEQLEPGDGQFPAERMCKVFDPTVLEVPYDGGTTSVEIVGMVGGKKARNELPTYGRHSVQFGIWLAKDHIKVERLNEAISHDNEFIHFLFVANCQDIELSANRGKIRNKASHVYQAIEDELDHYLSKVAHDPWFKKYMKARRQGEIARKAQSQSTSVETRITEVQSRGAYEATNSAEILFGLQRSNQYDGNREVTIEDYRPGDDLSSIVGIDGEFYAAAVRDSVKDHFEADAPLNSTDILVCWEWGDQDSLREIERQGYHNFEIDFDIDGNRIDYHDETGESGSIDVIAVESRLHRTEALVSH
jgi:hypothetical protein